jgi:hypothetical protein
VRRASARRAVWALIGAPVDGGRLGQAIVATIWSILRGGASGHAPDGRDLSRRYTDLLGESVGQPGFRELLLVAHDLDAGRDLVFGLLGDPYRKPLFSAASAPAARRAEAQDLGGLGREHLVDALLAALGLFGICESRLVTFAVDSYWRGETHRLVDRPASLGRLLEEAAAAGAEQAIVVSAAPTPHGPHEQRPTLVDGLGRIGEALASAEAAALADALRQVGPRFTSTYVIRPVHNPLRPLDLEGAYDERSDRHFSLEELMERGYEDAYRQFIEPVVGAGA